MKNEKPVSVKQIACLAMMMLLCAAVFSLKVHAEDTVSQEDTVSHPKDVTNVLLVGSDTREPGEYGNSDAMIMLTINHSAGKIFLVSFMRDLYADIPGHGGMKLNAAHAIGGGKLLMETIAENYKVKADNYIETEFAVMADLIDLLGGVTLELTKDEVVVANDYIKVMCLEQDKDYESNMIIGEGELNLTGLQAVGYARNRLVGDDYARTERQRKVLRQMLAKVSELDMIEITSIAVEILPKLHTDISLTDLISLAAQLPAASGYTLVTDRIPYDGLYHSENEILVPDMEETTEKLLSEIYEGCR